MAGSKEPRPFHANTAGLIQPSQPPEPFGTKAPPEMPSSTSVNGIRMIEGFEGFCAKMYNDSGGNCSVGYGHLLHIGPCTGKDPSEEPYLNGITQEQAEGLLKLNVATFEKVIQSVVTVDLNQNQFDALVSFVYNIGAGAFQSSSLLQKLNAQDYAAVPREMQEWVYAGGQKLEGLVIRRQKEAELFDEPVPAQAAEVGG